MLWVRIGFNADPDMDQAFYLNTEPDPGSQTNAVQIQADPDPDPDPGQLNFYMKNNT